MRTTTMTSVLALCALFGSAAAGTAAMLIPIVPVQGSTSTGALGINDKDVIAGSWSDSNGVEHGFFGSLAGSYATFDYTGNTAKGTEPRAIDDKELITGYGPTDGTGCFIDGPEFEYDGQTAFMRTITRHGRIMDGIAQGINKFGVFAGNYYDINRACTKLLGRYAYIGKNARWKGNLELSWSAAGARGINNAGTVVGYYLDDNGYPQGFILQNGVATEVVYPDNSEQQTVLEGLNDKGVATGQWFDNQGNGPYAFKWDSTTNTFTPLAPQGSTYQQAWGINDKGLIAFNDDSGAYIWCPDKPSKCPGAGVEVPDGLSIRGPVLKPVKTKPSERLRSNAPIKSSEPDGLRIPVVSHLHTN